MARPIVDWRKATFVGGLSGGVFWGLAAGAIYVAEASAIAIAGICVTAAVVMIAGALLYRRSSDPDDRTVGIGMVLAPLTGLAPVLAVSIPGLLLHAASWKG